MHSIKCRASRSTVQAHAAPKHSYHPKPNACRRGLGDTRRLCLLACWRARRLHGTGVQCGLEVDLCMVEGHEGGTARRVPLCRAPHYALGHTGAASLSSG